jgi:hypothetical protein
VSYSEKRKSTCCDISAETAAPETMTPTAPTTTVRVAAFAYKDCRMGHATVSLNNWSYGRCHCCVSD